MAILLLCIMLSIHVIVIHGQESVTASYTTSCSTDDRNFLEGSAWFLKCEFTNFVQTDITLLNWFIDGNDNQIAYTVAGGIVGGDLASDAQIESTDSTSVTIRLPSLSTTDLSKTWTCDVTVNGNNPRNDVTLQNTPCNGLVSCYVCIPTTEPITEDNLANTTICSQTTNCAYCKKSVTQNGDSKTAVRSCESSCSQDETTGTYCCNNEDLCNPASTITPDLLLPFALVLTAVQCAYGIY